MPVYAHIADGPVRPDIQRYCFVGLTDPPIEIKFARLPGSGPQRWTRIDDNTPSVPWDVIYQLVSIRPISDEDGDEVYAYEEVRR